MFNNEDECNSPDVSIGIGIKTDNIAAGGQYGCCESNGKTQDVTVTAKIYAQYCENFVECADSGYSGDEFGDESLQVTQTMFQVACPVANIWGITTTLPVVSSNELGHFVEVIGTNGRSTVQTIHWYQNYPRIFFRQPQITQIIGDKSVKGNKVLRIIGSEFGPIPSLNVAREMSLTMGGLIATKVTWVTSDELSFVSPEMTLESGSATAEIILTIENVIQENSYKFSFAPPQLTTVTMWTGKPKQFGNLYGIEMTLKGSEFADLSNIRVFTDNQGSACTRYVDCYKVLRDSFSEISCIFPKSDTTYGCTEDEAYVTVSGQTSNAIEVCYPQQDDQSNMLAPSSVKIYQEEGGLQVKWETETELEQIGDFQIQLSNNAEFFPILYDTDKFWSRDPNQAVIVAQHITTNISRTQIFTGK